MLRVKRAPSLEGSFQDGAALDLLAAKLTNAELIEPLEFGASLVSTSGIFSAINAIRLAVAHQRQLTGAEVHTMMAASFDYLSARLTAKQVFQAGIRISVWRGMLNATLETARQRLGLKVGCERLMMETDNREATFKAIETSIERWRPVLMLCRGGRYRVVCGFTPSSLLLFDSAACWMSKNACGTPNDREHSRHLLIPSSLMALRV